MLQEVVCQSLYNRVTVSRLHAGSVGPKNERLLALDNADATVSAFPTVDGSPGLTPQEDVVLAANFDAISFQRGVVPGDTRQEICDFLGCNLYTHTQWIHPNQNTSLDHRELF